MEEDIKAAELNDSGSRETDIAVIPEPVAIVEQAVSPATEARVITVQADGSDVLRISFSGESWVEVNDGASNEIYRDLLEAGDILQITGTAPFNVLLGDAPFTELTFNGDEVDVSGNIRIDNSARLTVGL
jgi:cytoskeleton protein RodZ